MGTPNADLKSKAKANTRANEGAAQQLKCWLFFTSMTHIFHVNSQFMMVGIANSIRDKYPDPL
jgi:hypothetical protein